MQGALATLRGSTAMSGGCCAASFNVVASPSTSFPLVSTLASALAAAITPARTAAASSFLISARAAAVTAFPVLHAFPAVSAPGVSASFLTTVSAAATTSGG